ncbi:MAG: hypothetical protein ACPHXR_01475 [Flavicella sp.]
MKRKYKHILITKLEFQTLLLGLVLIGCSKKMTINEDICYTVNVYATQEEKKYLNDVERIQGNILAAPNSDKAKEHWCELKVAIENYLTYLDSIKECTEFSVEKDLEGKIQDLNDELEIAKNKSGPECD